MLQPILDAFPAGQISNGDGVSALLSFNLADALTSVQYPSARQITYGYEAATNRVSSVTGTQGASTTYALSPISYFAHGGLNSMSLGNGLVESWIFNRCQPSIHAKEGKQHIRSCSDWEAYPTAPGNGAAG